MKKTLFTTFAICAALCSCDTNKTTSVFSPADLPGKWLIVKAGDMATDKAEQPPFINFTDSGTVNGYATVNHFFGNYTAKGDSISFDHVGITSMMGPDMEMEMAIMQAINNGKTVRLQGDSLMLQDAVGKTVMTMKRD